MGQMEGEYGNTYTSACKIGSWWEIAGKRRRRVLCDHTRGGTAPPVAQTVKNSPAVRETWV